MKERQHLLIVEDDTNVAEVMRHESSGLGYVVSVVDTVDKAKRQSAVQLPDMVILDRMLADGGDGLGYLSWLDDLEGRRPGVLIASRLSAASDHVTGLEAGADDYINKPFDTAELRARLRAIARRASTNRAPNSVLFFANLEIRKVSGVALINNKPLDLQPQKFALLSAIASRQGEWVSRKALWHEVWTDYRNLRPQDTVINTAISRLRRALETIAGAPTLLSEDFGYRLVADDAHGSET